MIYKVVNFSSVTFFFFHFFLLSVLDLQYIDVPARGPIGAAAAGLHHMGSEPHLQPTLQLTATLDP